MRARWSVAPSRLALLANRSAASTAVRAASAASANRPSADSEIARFARVNGTSAGAWSSRTRSAARKSSSASRRPPQFDECRSTQVERRAELNRGSRELGRIGGLAGDRLGGVRVPVG